MLRKILAIAMLVFALHVAVASAWTYEQARTGTLNFTYQHCGSYWRTCNGFWFIQCYGTGTNRTDETQWACLGGDNEKRKWWAWWLTPYKTCTIGVAFLPSGKVNTWSKLCDPIGGV